ncbi:alkaline shock response membrane anchor protein AmaP [Lentilactobacillus kisonensis]|uniref:alkaline shock response membrane anchor protein AmaP n=1 Tax=Lentilactobacillus kisonensis TaxID=481722 RepID=UPI000A6514C0|nr:alkaline shock response membrane anchor protein AmaP [Lentilactobacillus kisonensis]
MNRLTKLLILVVSMIGIVQSVWFIGLVIPIDYLSKMVLQTVQTNVDWIMILALVGSVIVGFVAIMAIITILVAPRKADKIVFRSANGRLSISKKSRGKIA